MAEVIIHHTPNNNYTIVSLICKTRDTRIYEAFDKDKQEVLLKVFDKSTPRDLSDSCTDFFEDRGVIYQVYPKYRKEEEGSDYFNYDNGDEVDDVSLLASETKCTKIPSILGKSSNMEHISFVPSTPSIKGRSKVGSDRLSNCKQSKKIVRTPIPRGTIHIQDLVLSSGEDEYDSDRDDESSNSEDEEENTSYDEDDEDEDEDEDEDDKHGHKSGKESDRNERAKRKFTLVVVYLLIFCIVGLLAYIGIREYFRPRIRAILVDPNNRPDSSRKTVSWADDLEQGGADLDDFGLNAKKKGAYTSVPNEDTSGDSFELEDY